MPTFTPDELANLSEVVTALCDTLSEALTKQLGRSVSLRQPECATSPIESLAADSSAFVQCVFSPGILEEDQSLAGITEQDAAAIVAENSGAAPPDGPVNLSQEEEQRIGEALRAVARSLSMAVAGALKGSPPSDDCELSYGPLALPPCFALSPQVIRVRIALAIDESACASLHLFFTPGAARSLLDAANDSAPIGATGAADFGAPAQTDRGRGSAFASPSQPDGVAGAVQFQPFEPFGPLTESLPGGLGLIMDIPLDVTVELGRVRMLIKDVLDLSAGSIVELDRIAGEPVDLMVNGRLVAKGEVVVIEDNFGMRITEIMSPGDRLTGMGKR